MAIKKHSDLPISPMEQGVHQTPLYNEPERLNLNKEFIYDPQDIPLSPGLNDEFFAMQNLKRNQLDLQNSEALKHIAGTRTFVTYFNQVSVKANNDFSNVTAPNSVNTTKYNRIDNCIIIIDSELTPSFNNDNGLVTNEITGSGYMFPGFRVYPNDLFYVHELPNQKGVLYLITNVEPVTQLENTGWKIEFTKHYDQFDLDTMTNLIDGHYVFNFSNVGTENKIIIERSIYELYKILDDVFTTISNEYLSRFFDYGANVIRFVKDNGTSFIDNFIDNMVGVEPEESHEAWMSHHRHFPNDNLLEGHVKEHIFDPYLMKFILNNFSRHPMQHKGYSVCPMIPVWISDKYTERYKYTIYNAIVQRNPKYIKFDTQIAIPFNVRTERELRFKDWSYFEMVEMDASERIIENKDYLMYPMNLIDNIKLNKLYNKDDPYEKYNVLIQFINDPERKFVPTAREFAKFKEEIEFEDDNILYGTAPLIMYMCIYYMDLISRKTY